MKLTIESIAAGGDGVGRLEDGLTVFVPRAAPGDVLDVELTVRKARWGRGRIREIVTPGPGRVTPECRHYEADSCGGCQLQHLSLEAQHAAKRRIVGEALRRIGGLSIEDPPLGGVGEPWRYRRRVTFSARAGDTVGFRRYGEPDRGFVVEDCRIADERLMRLWRDVRPAVAGMPGLTAITLRLDHDDAPHVVVQGGIARDVRSAAAILGARGEKVGWWLDAPGRPARPVAGPAADGAAPLGFEQVNPELADVIRRQAVAALRPGEGERAWDLFGGRGETARLLAAAGARVWSVDRDRETIAYARRCLAHPSVTFVTGRVEDTLADLPRPDRIVVNPPREGLGRQVAHALNAWAEVPGGTGGPAFAYVSCDPATLARDLAWMSALTVRDVVTYDLFPQTSHVETLALLAAAGAAP